MTAQPATTSPIDLITLPWFVSVSRHNVLGCWLPGLVILGTFISTLVGWIQRALERWAEGVSLKATIKSSDPAYQWVTKYLKDGHVWEGTSEFEVFENHESGYHGDFKINDGAACFFKFKGILCLVIRTSANNAGSLTVKLFSGDRQLVKDFIAAAHSYHKSQQPEVSDDEKEEEEDESDDEVTLRAYAPSGSYWDRWSSSETIRPKPFSNPFFSDVKEKLVQDIKSFFEDSASHETVGITHRRRYLLHGPEGAGKMSTIYGVATDLKKNVYCLNMGSTWLKDAKLSQLLSLIPKDAITVIEDVDEVFPPRTVPKDGEKDTSCNVSLGALLSTIEGNINDDGKIIFILSKYVVPDPILLRKGRIDYSVKFTYATRQQMIDLFKYTFNASHEGFKAKDHCAPLTPPGTPRTDDEKITEIADVTTLNNTPDRDSINRLAEEFADAVPEGKYLQKELRRFLFAFRQSDPADAVKGVGAWMKVLDDEKRRIAGDDGLL